MQDRAQSPPISDGEFEEELLLPKSSPPKTPPPLLQITTEDISTGHTQTMRELELERIVRRLQNELAKSTIISSPISRNGRALTGTHKICSLDQNTVPE